MKKPPLEKTIVNNTIDMINSRGGWCVKTHGGPFQMAGLPDIIGCYRGRFISFEVKRDEKKKTSPLQAWVLSRIRHAGGVAQRIHAVQQATSSLDRIDAELGGPAPRNHN